MRTWSRMGAAGTVVAALLTLLVFTGSALAIGTFVDDDGNIHESNIEKIAAAGVTLGCNPPDNDRYCPDDNVTRQQMASFLVRAFDLPPANTNQFTDTAGSVHANDIEALAASGITRGCNPPTNDQYCPTDVVTRGQMAAFIARGLGLDNVDTDFFGDDNTSEFETQINAIARVGITKGCNPPDNTEYCPQNPVRRDEMASFLSRVLNIVTTGTTSTTTPSVSTSSTTTIPGGTTTTSLPGTGRNVFFSVDGTRQPAQLLAGSSQSGNAYIFAGPDAGVTQTRFYVDDAAQSGSPYRVENFSKFDLGGTAANGDAKPFDTLNLKNGSHNVTAAMVLSAGGEQVLSSTFNVSNSASVWLASRTIGFNLPPNGSSGTPKAIQVDSNNGAAINWTATENSPWLTLVNNSGTAGQNVTFNASAVGASPGVSNAVVTVSAPGFASRTFTVTRNVIAVGSCPSLNGMADVQVATPFALSFGASVGGSVASTGFTCVQATENGVGYIGENLSLDTSGGTLSIATTSGNAAGSTNSQDNALGVGFDAAGGTTVLSTTLLSPSWEANGGFEQAGLWAGIHDDTYVKAVLIDFSGSNRLQLYSESLGVMQGNEQVTLPAAAPGTLRLVMTLNDATNTASLSYSINGGPLTALGDSVPVAQGVFTGQDPDGAGPSGVVSTGGIFASHSSGQAKTYTFADFGVSN